MEIAGGGTANYLKDGFNPGDKLGHLHVGKSGGRRGKSGYILSNDSTGVAGRDDVGDGSRPGQGQPKNDKSKNEKGAGPKNLTKKSNLKL